MVFEPNALFYWMLQKYSENSHHKKQIRICNEGGARSSKTWDTIHLIVAFCDQHRYKDIPLKIAFFRNTLKDSRDKLYEEDFKLCLKTIGIYDKSNARKENQSPEYNLWGNDIFFRGLDESTEQPTYDIVFINESLEVPSYAVVAGLLFRCRLLSIMDWNPKYTDHWCFDLEGQPLTFFSKTTYLNNKKLDISRISNIVRFSPWHLEDLHLPEDQRRPHEENIKNGTADKFYFLVYGMGQRGAREGLVFPNVTWINEFPKQVERVFYGLDFGFTNDPSAFVRVGVLDGCLYLQGLIYEPTENVIILEALLSKFIDKTAQIWADLSDRGMIGDLQQMGYSVNAASKWAGCIEYRVDMIKRFKLHIVTDKNFKKEQENYFFREINGYKLSTPDPNSKHCHYWDAVGYAVQHELR